MPIRFLDEEKKKKSSVRFLDDQELTPSGQFSSPAQDEALNAQLNQIGESVLNALPGGSMINEMAPGAKTIAGEATAGFPDTLLSIGKSLIQPENIIKKDAGIAAGSVGGPAASVPVASLAGAATSVARTAQEAPPPQNIDQFLTESTLNAVPVVGGLLSATERAARSETKTPQEMALDALGASLSNAGTEAISLGISNFLGKAPTLLPKTSQAYKEIAFDLEKHELKPSLASATDSSVLDWLDGVARNGPVSRQMMNKLDVDNIANLNSWIDEVSGNLVKGFQETTGRELRGKLLKQNVNIGKEAAKKISDLLYENLDSLAGGKLQPIERTTFHPGIPDVITGISPDVGRTIQTTDYVGGVTVPTNELKKYAINKLANPESIRNVTLASASKRDLLNISKFPDTMNFSQAQEVRSRMLDIARSSNDPSIVRLASEIASVTDKSMEKAAQDLSPAALAAWRKANKFYKLGKQTFENDFMAKYFINDGKAPEDIGQAIYGQGNVTEIKNVKKALRLAQRIAPDRVNYDESVKSLQGGFNQAFLNKNRIDNPSLPRGRTYNFKGMLADLNNEKISDTMKELFPPEHIEELKRFAKAGDLLTSKQGGGSPFAFMQAGAIVGAALRPTPKTITAASFIVGLPAATAKLLTSPKALKIMSEGFTEASKGTKASFQAISDSILRAAKEAFTPSLSELSGIKKHTGVYQ